MLGLLRRAAVAMQQAYEAGQKVVADSAKPFTIQDKTGSGYFFVLLSNLGANVLRVSGSAVALSKSLYMNNQPIVLGTGYAGARIEGTNTNIDLVVSGSQRAQLADPTTPAAGDTALLLAYYDGTAWQPVGRVVYKDGASIGAGDKVLVVQ